MCQQWFSVAGQTFDIVGFLLIAFEWRRMFVEEKLQRREELLGDGPMSYATLRKELKEAGERVGFRSEQQQYNWVRHWQRWYVSEFRGRMLLFYGGASLVIVGFVLQVVGSLPLSVSGLVSCQ